MAKDPYKYFRIEAREIVDRLGQGVLDLEKGQPSADVIPRLLRLSHTLKGAARVVKQREIADTAHAIEDALEPFREATSTVPQQDVDGVLTLIDSISSRLTALNPVAESQESHALPVAHEETTRTVRADVAEVDVLLNGMAETHLQLATIRQSIRSLAQVQRVADLLVHQITAHRQKGAPQSSEIAAAAKAESLVEEIRTMLPVLERNLTGGVERIDRELSLLRDGAERLRLLPANILFGLLERVARDTARAVGARVLFEAKGGEVRLDAHVLEVIQGALVQIVRNAVAHGIEREGERTALNKSPEGSLRIEVVRRRERVAFVCTDDGRGLDVEAIRGAAQRKGLLSADIERLGPDELLRLLLKGGISTSESVTEVSGRGIGLDVVREAAERLGGDVAVMTETGKGTVMEVIVPVSLSSLEALIVEASGVSASIPLDGVLGTLRVGSKDVTRLAEGENIIYEGRMIPFIPLHRLLGQKGRGVHTASVQSAVVIHSRIGMAAVAVDKLIGTGTVVLRSLPGMAPADRIIAGVSLDESGDPQVVLDPEGLVARAQRAEHTAVADTPPRHRVLVIDDSLTTRMLEQSILEGAGYEVDIATSGEEGLSMALRQPYRLFLCDVEMPGMDGFTFVEQTRTDPVLRQVPAILVTSRDAPDDRKRGRDAGAMAYIVKSEFDQTNFLENVRSLIG